MVKKLQLDEGEVEIGSPEEAYWTARIKDSENAIKDNERSLMNAKQAIDQVPRNIAFHQMVIKLCKEELKKAPKL